MENAADALKMAGSVLIFVLALSIVVVMFTQARETADAVLAFSDRESLRIDENENYYYLGSNNIQREVGIETIIPALYRAYKENYRIVFKFDNDNYCLFENKSGKVKKIDLREQTIGSDQESRDFLNAVLYHNYDAYDKDEMKFKQRYSITQLPSDSLYNYIKGFNGTITEYLGTYYMEDIETEEEKAEMEAGEETVGAVEEVNKNEKRIITYTFTQRQ